MVSISTVHSAANFLVEVDKSGHSLSGRHNHRCEPHLPETLSVVRAQGRMLPSDVETICPRGFPEDNVALDVMVTLIKEPFAVMLFIKEIEPLPPICSRCATRCW